MLLSYPWPGNVRELENVVQRAVVLCPDAQIDAMHLMFDDALMGPEPAPQPSFHQAPHPAPFKAEPESLYNTRADSPYELHGPLCEAEFKALFPFSGSASISSVGHLQTAVKSNEHQLIMAAIQNTESRIEAARQLGISPRTLRYKLAKLKVGNDMPAMALAR
jgi:two-component system response regulator FlrC